jgi:putative transcriptional regulator
MSKKVPDISFTNKILPKQGRILISDPFLGDEYFERSVVYICQHSKEGTFGFVLNHFLEVNLKELNENFPPININLSLGGPVDKEVLYFMHSLGDKLNDSLDIGNGLFIGGDFEQLYSLVDDEAIENHKVRFFLGYSGWGEDQLSGELKENAWIVSKVDDKLEIMDTEKDDIWKYFMNKMGPKYKLMSDFPLDPNEN